RLKYSLLKYDQRIVFARKVAGRCHGVATTTKISELDTRCISPSRFHPLVAITSSTMIPTGKITPINPRVSIASADITAAPQYAIRGGNDPVHPRRKK